MSTIIFFLMIFFIYVAVMSLSLDYALFKDYYMTSLAEVIMLYLHYIKLYHYIKVQICLQRFPTGLYKYRHPCASADTITC